MGTARLDIDVVDHGPAVVVRPVGWLVADNYRTLAEKLDELLSGGRTRVALDLSKAQVLASPLLGVFVYYAGAMGQAGGQFALAAPLGSVRRMISAAGLDDKLEVFESVAEALRACGGDPGEEEG
ncbi:MAG: STAS domain-containing protein [Planctomycetota bacterium]|jgi:anti-anti-sigma factor